MIAGKIFAALSETGQKIGEQDPFIAAVAIANDRPLVTTTPATINVSSISALPFGLRTGATNDRDRIS